MALIADGKEDEAKSLLIPLQQAGAKLAPDDGAGFSPAKDVVALAVTVLKSRLAAAAGQESDSIALPHDAAAAAREDALAYDEPADWFISVRRQLGAALLKSRQAKAAEVVHREDLHRNRDNGWSLFGLIQALNAQGRRAEAAAAQAAFQKAWARSDISLTASAF